MPSSATILIPPSTVFWDDAARALLQSDEHGRNQGAAISDLSALRVLVSTFAHIQLLKNALARQIGGAFIPPTITSLSEYIRQLPPSGTAATAASERLMSLYADLRQHAWLKKLFSARRNTDLLPLAEILLALSDELTQAMLPSLKTSPDAGYARWQAALEQLSPVARNLLSDETQLVWTIWKSQLDASDANVMRYAQMMRLVQQVEHMQQPLFWISPVAPDAMEQAFLDAYGARQALTVLTLDWHAHSINSTYAAAWPEMLVDETGSAALPIATPSGLKLHAAQNMEAEARAGAQTVIDWLQQGKTNIAIVAQDRVVARRIRALLERAQIMVADETGWKLSTTRAASAIAAWLELVAARAETAGLLDFLKSPFVFADMADKAEQVMVSEIALQRAKVLSGWEAVSDALTAAPAAQKMMTLLAQQASGFTGRKTLCEWIAATQQMLLVFGMRDALQADAAGAQLIQLLQDVAQDCVQVGHTFSFAEWRAFLNLQLEAKAFVQVNQDKRVVMLPLNGARLRSFDAVLMVGADAEHLPSQPMETLFFANVVRRELGLATRESRQRQQLRDVTELLSANDCVVLSWQAHKNGEPNPVSPWIERLELCLARAGLAPLAKHEVQIAPRHLQPTPVLMPAPAAPQLLPQKLSASGYNSLVACPYQFFATRMLGLSGIDDVSDMPEKRDYGDWLHQILAQFHQTLQEAPVPLAERAPLLQQISDRIFAHELDKSAAALGYYARWQKAMPAYLEWIGERESQGWHFVLGEEKFEKLLRWDGGEIVLHGRVDRMDENAEGERAVLDYKSTNQGALRDKLRQGEDHQLPFYGLLSGTALSAALYVPLEATRDKIKEVEAPDYEVWQHNLEEQIVRNMQAITHGAPLPATGPEPVCQYCDVRGLCRKGAW
ncbi:PD-(D/E)XK nuclease family protein [Herminiimonas sp. NPDC097707]|uniref:PD-(D/E)XK nuclease family protein n=1 Tax=Herminiimonas sp. NPDC097707 TaxID=3364007 RepID=UPI00383BDF41